MSSDPADGAFDASRSGVLRVAYDRQLAPWTVHRGTVGIRSGRSNVFLSVRLDPVNNEIVAAPFTGTPLFEHVEYTIDVEGVRDLDGVLAEPFEAVFVTGEQVGPGLEQASTGWDVVAPIFREGCGGSGCHDRDSPALGLDLSTPEAVRRTALGVPAVQTGAREGFPVRGLNGLPIVDIIAGGGRPATSYLVYKLLGDSHASGEPMPPDESLSRLEIEQISDWILGGAPTTL